MNLVTPKAGTNHKLLFNEPASDHTLSNKPNSGLVHNKLVCFCNILLTKAIA
jgi:hypothetical protein